MKYLVFSGVLLCLPALVVLMVLDRRLVRWVMLIGVLMPVVLYEATALNFFSAEEYRGTSRGMEVSLIYVAALALLLAFAILRGQFFVAPGAGPRLYLLYLLLSLPSLTTAANRLFSWFEIWKMLMMLAVFLAVYGYLEFSRGDFSVLLLGAGLVAAVNFLVIVNQHFHGIYQVRGVFPHQNSMAMFMTLAAMLFLACFFNQSGRARSRRWILLVCALASFAVFRSFSRGAIACFSAGAVLTVLCSMVTNFSPRKVPLLLGLMMLAAVGMLYFTPKLLERFETANEVSWNTRVRLAAAAANMIRDEPWRGVGLNNWGIKINPPYEYSLFREERSGATDDWKDGIVETIYLLVAAECGVPCLVALVLWFAYYLVVCMLLIWRLRHTEYFFVPAGLLGGLAAVYAQSSLEWVLKQQMNFIWLMVFFAMLTYLNNHWRQLRAQAQTVNRSKAAAPEPAPENAVPQEGDVPLAEGDAPLEDDVPQAADAPLEETNV